MSLTMQQWIGIAAAAAGVISLWGPSAWTWVKARASSATVPNGDDEDDGVDLDYQDLLALRRLQDRAAELGCPELNQGIYLIQRNFFGCVPNDTAE